MPHSPSMMGSASLWAARNARTVWSATRAWGACALIALPAALGAQGLPLQNANAALSSALIRLNHNPRDTEALIAAGNAALTLGDTDAAVGFFTRADRLAPGNAGIEAGLAGAKVRGEDPFSAIALFATAEKAGPIPPALLGDRGLAYDLVGDNISAQRYYHQALASGANDEVSRRLALSLAIGGDRRASETVLAGLLQKRDRAAWRTRIFALAILGYEEEAVSTAKATMPPEMALEIAPYLRYMRQLTPAQQAAAANLGHFPQAAEIGHDDPRVAQYARPPLAADRGLIPAGAPLGASANAASPLAGEQLDKRRKDKTKRKGLAVSAPAAAGGAATAPGNSAPPELMVSRETQSPPPSLLVDAAPKPLLVPTGRPVAGAVVRPAAPIQSARLVPVPSVQPAPSARPAVSPPPPLLPAVTQSPPAMPPSAAPGPVLAAKPAAPALAPPPRPHLPEAAARPGFSEAFAGMSPAVVDITPERGAVDLRRIKPARAIPPPPPPPSHPSRIWVELGVGRDADRLAFDWRRMVRDDPEIFRGKQPFVSGWARTNRLLVGPFETDKAATAFTDKLHRADHATAFVWTSPAGQVVDPLDEP